MHRALILAGLIVWVVFHIQTGLVLEDALITFRYADNLASGEGFAYNPSQPVLGTTTPLFTLFLAGCGLLFGTGAIPTAALAAGLASGVISGWLLHATLIRIGWSRGLSLFVTAAFLFHPETLWTTTGGMETPLVLLLMVVSLHALARGSPLTAATAAGILVLTRIDGVVWAGVVLVAIFMANRPALLRSLVTMTAVITPWFVFAFLYFGSPIPHSIIAKRTIGTLTDPFTAGHLAAFASWVTPFFGSIWPRPPWVGLCLSGVGCVLIFRSESPRWLRPVVLFPLLFAALLLAGRSPLYFDWYLAPIRLPALIAGGLGVWGLFRMAAGSLPRRVTGTAAAVALILYGVFILRLDGEMLRFHHDYQINEDGTRKRIGLWLEGNTPPDALVAMEAIGYQGYYSRRRILDLAGLVSPEVVRIRRENPGNARAFERILEELRPDFIVLRSFEVDRNLHFHGGPLFETDRTAGQFRARYEEIRRFEAPLPELWGPTAYLTVYRRRF